MLKVAIVGCGKVADEHAEQILRVDGCTLSAFCDRELLMARQMHDRFGRVPYFDDLDDMLRRVRPDVVHVTTPPQTHAQIAKRCLREGCHVYVEKPFTVDAGEAKSVLDEAARLGLQVTVGHNLMFSDRAVEMRRLVADGYLGGPPVHCDAYYCYDLDNAGYAKAFLGQAGHWVRQLPGGLMQNVISHGISRIVEYLPQEDVTIEAHGFTSAALARVGATDVKDELRVILRSGPMTAYFTLSSQMRPALSELRLYGPRNGLVLSDNQHAVIKLAGKRPKSYLAYFVTPARLGSQYLRASLRNVRDFATWRLHMSAGTKRLIERFYRSITHGEAPPFSYRDMLLTVRIMDVIFEQLRGHRHGNAVPGLLQAQR